MKNPNKPLLVKLFMDTVMKPYKRAWWIGEPFDDAHRHRARTEGNPYQRGISRPHDRRHPGKYY